MAPTNRRCAVLNCKRPHKEGSLFRPPHPNKYWDLFLLWVKATGNPKYAQMDAKECHKKMLICEVHFSSEELIELRNRVKRCIPSKNLPDPIEVQLGIDTDAAPASAVTFCAIEKENILTPKRQATAILEGISPKRPFLDMTNKEPLASTSQISECSPVTVTSECRNPIEVQLDIDTDAAPASAITFCAIEKENILTPKRQATAILEGISPKRPFLDMTNKEPLASTSQTYECSPMTVTSECRSVIRSPIIPPTRLKNLSPKALQLYNQVNYLKRKGRRLNQSKASLKKRLLEARKVIHSQNIQKLTENLTPFQKRFFACQLRNVRLKRKARRFTLEEKLDSLLLWKTSPSTYRNLNRLGFNLPTSVTLRKLLRQIPVGPGISQVVFDSLGNNAKSMTDKDKCCIILFDEMAIQPHLDYDVHRDRVVGFEAGNQNIADHATVFMLRGVFKKWKQPVGFMFHKSAMSASTIVNYYREIVMQCEKIGFIVIASVCDQGTNNVKAINMLTEESKRNLILKGVEPRDYIITVSNSSIVPLFDPPHLLKSIRNNLLTKDLTYSVDGIKKRASWCHIQKAYNIDRSNNIRVMKKIHDLHIVPQKIKKMKVSIAAQVFSATVATAIKYCALSGLQSTDGISQLDASALETAELLLIFDNLFDSVNSSSSKCDGKHLKQLVSAKSSHAAEWLRSLRIINSMEFIKSKSSDRSRPPVLEGWKKTINGFLQIRKRLMDLGYSKFGTRMFNQDPLENFFCQMRQYGVRNVNPTCIDFCSYYKALLIKNIQYHPKDSNCEEDLSESIATIREMIKPCQLPNEPADRWHIPDITQISISQIESAAIGYVSGFLCNELFKKIPNCAVCKKNLLHDAEDTDDFHHKLTSLKEYDFNARKLKYSSINLIKNLVKMYNLLQIYIPDAIGKNYLKERVVNVLKCKVMLQFEECVHRNDRKFHI